MYNTYNNHKNLVLMAREKESFDFHKKIYDGYVALAESDPERIKRIDASKPVEEVHAQVLKVLEGLI